MSEKKRASGVRPKKRRPPLNRYMAADQIEAEAGPCHADATEAEPTVKRHSASFRKVEPAAEVENSRSDRNGFSIIDIDEAFRKITEHLCCRKCRGPADLKELKYVGLSSVFQLECDKCGVLSKFRNSDLENSEGHTETEVNKRFVYASQVLGFEEGMKKLSAIMDFPPPIGHKLYQASVRKIHRGVKEAAKEATKAALKEETEAEGSTDISISGDRTCQKRGFSSQNGVVTAVGAHTGKAVDVEVLTTVCQRCSNYKGPKHGDEYGHFMELHECSINHEGSSGMMEVTGIKRICERAEAGVRYKNYIGDGDSKIFGAIVQAKPYGPDFTLTKSECVGHGHVQKRMGTRLRKLNTQMRGKKLEDGKTLGGAGRLTDKMIDSIASYYGNAIRESTDVPTMKDKIWAIFCHYSSTDTKPQHHLCPKGADSWCKYQKSFSRGKENDYRHRLSIPEAVMNVIKPAFEDLTKADLLGRCVGGKTQNPNESLNSLIWKNFPKNVICGRTVLEIGVYDAVLSFNSGQKSRLRVLRKLGVNPGKFCVNYLNQADQERVLKAEKKIKESLEEAKKLRRQQEKERSELQKEKEGPVHSAGEF